MSRTTTSSYTIVEGFNLMERSHSASVTSFKAGMGCGLCQNTLIPLLTPSLLSLLCLLLLLLQTLPYLWHTLEPEHLAMTMQILASRGYEPPNMQWLFRVLVIMYVQESKFTAQDVARVLWGVSVITRNLNHLPSKRWLKAFSGRFESQLGSCGARELAEGLWGLVKMKHVPLEVFMSAWEARGEAVGWSFGLAQAQEAVEAYGILQRAVPRGLERALEQQQAIWKAQEEAARAGAAAALADAAKLQQALLAAEEELVKKVQGPGKKKGNSSRRHWNGQAKKKGGKFAAAVAADLLQPATGMPQLATAT